MNAPLRILACLLAAAAVLAPVHGQEKPAPPPRPAALPADSVRPSAEEPLPSIDLPEFQITGREQIDLAEFPREAADPGRGLGPPDTDPQPGERTENSAPLGDDPRGAAAFAGAPPALRGRAIAGYGSYRTPFFDASFGNTTPAFGFLLRAGFISSAGFDPNTQYRKGHGDLSADWTAQENGFLPEGSRIEGAFGLSGHTYRLYGSTEPESRRSLSRVRLDGRLTTRPSEDLLTGGDVRISTFSAADSITVRHSALDLGAFAEHQAGRVLFRAEAGASFGFYDAPTRDGQPYTHRIGLTATATVLPSLDLTGGLTGWFFRPSAGDGRVRLTPAAELTWYAMPGLALYGRYRPEVRTRTLEGLLEENPYLAVSPDLFPLEQLTALEAGVRWDAGDELSLRAAIRHALARGDLHYVPAAGTWTLLRDGIARRTGLDVDVTARPGVSDLLAVSLTLEGTRSTATGEALPYAPVIRGTARYEHRFPFGLEAGAALTAVGERTATPAADRRLPAFVLADVSASYPVLDLLRLRAELNNIANTGHRWWDGYRPVPRSLTVSLAITW